MKYIHVRVKWDKNILCFFEYSLQEWILEKYDKTQFKFTFLGKTLDLEISFEDEEKIKNIQLSSQISGMIEV